MIRIQLRADGLARSRFALSPLGETVHLLLAAAGGTVPRPLRAPLRDAVLAHRLDLLAALLRVEPGAGHYVPDFLTPPAPRFENSADDELHAIATTPGWRVAGELAVAADGRVARLVGRELPRVLHTALDAGEAHVAARLAEELQQVWIHVLAPHWPRLRARMEADVMLRLRTVGEHGFGAALDGLSPKVDWHGDTLRVRSTFETTVPERSVVLLPSVFTPRVACVIDTMTTFPGRGCAMTAAEKRIRRSAMLFYPVGGKGPGTAPEPRRPAELIGRTRARILAATATPATTGEVAGRLRLSPSTVSYHLQILHRAGLVRRTRDARSVLYQSL
ncbi:helix-turn-helix domain-containing protein [Catenulispora subtropica]|uniref:ArsR family transcriptional regulator n=1 Tax=Catenulispora subtropica TaxID=450798 RepID=A0ABN2R9G3_9ACTN